MVTGALTSVGQTIALAYEHNPTKSRGSYELVPRLQQAMVGRRKVDPPTPKKKPAAVDTPKFLAKMGLENGSPEIVKAVGGFYADYFLLFTSDRRIYNENDKK